MRYRRLGKTNLQVSEIGMGTWQITDDPEWGKGPLEKDTYQVLQKFIDLGGNLIDTAWVYGYREDKPDSHPSEELIGRFLKQTNQRDKVIITSKIPPLDLEWPIPKGRRMQDVFPEKFILKCVDDSLRGLQTDHIELMLFHAWRDEFNDEDAWKDVCTKLTKEGKVLNWGFSPNYFYPGGGNKTLTGGIMSVVQCIFNVFHQKPITELFNTARTNDIGIVACVPFDEGGLTGRITNETVFADDDFRKQYFAGERLQELVKRTDDLQKLLGEEATTLPELALRFILSFDEMSSVIPGMRKLRNVELNTAISDGRKLSPSLIEELKKHTWERNFYPWATADGS